MIISFNYKKISVPAFNEANGFHTTKSRSELMKKIKSKGTKPEIKLKKALWSSGFRYRKNVKSLPGKPDIVLTKFKLAIFIDGEFWHGYNWNSKKNLIKSNREYWIPKIERNIQRDKFNEISLLNRGWHVMRFWSKYVENDFENCIFKIKTFCSKLTI